MVSSKKGIQDINKFIYLFPTTSTKELEKIFSVSRATITREAKKHELVKDKEYLHRMRSERASNRIMSDEWRAKLSASAKGRELSDETKAKILATKKERGTLPKREKNPNWKGGKPPWGRFKDPLYRDWRNSVLIRDNYTCQHCHRICKKQEKGLAAHHIKPYATHPELRLEISNGITLCRQCHMTVHNKKLIPKELIECACGCGTMISPVNCYGNGRKYVNGHYNKGKKLSEETIEKIRIAKKGIKVSPETIAKRSASFRKKDSSVYKYPTMKEQGRHRSNNRLLEVDGVVKCIAEWSELTGIHFATITTRLKNGWNSKDAVSIPPSKKNSNRRGKGKANYKKP